MIMFEVSQVHCNGGDHIHLFAQTNAHSVRRCFGFGHGNRPFDQHSLQLVSRKVTARLCFCCMIESIAGALQHRFSGVQQNAHLPVGVHGIRIMRGSLAATVGDRPGSIAAVINRILLCGCRDATSIAAWTNSAAATTIMRCSPHVGSEVTSFGSISKF